MEQNLTRGLNLQSLLKSCLLSVLVSMGSCKSETSSRSRIFFVSHAGAGDSFWTVCYQGLEKAAKDFDVDVHFMAPEIPNDIARQVEILDAVIASKPDAIVTTLPNARSFSKSLQKAKSFKIPVLVVNTRPHEHNMKKNPYLAFIGMDDYEAGKSLAEYALEHEKLSKRVLIANHQPGHIGLENRLKGIRETLDKEKIHTDIVDISNDPSEVQNIIQTHLKRHPEIKTLFCLGPECVHGIGRYFRDQEQDIVMASFDISMFTKQLIEEKIVAFAIDQQPFQQGYRSVEELVKILRDGLEPKDVDTRAIIVEEETSV